MTGMRKRFGDERDWYHIEAVTGGNQGGSIVVKIKSNYGMYPYNVESICRDIRKAKIWLDQQWLLRCTRPDGHLYWGDPDEDGALTPNTTQHRSANSPRKPTRFDLLDD